MTLHTEIEERTLEIKPRFEEGVNFAGNIPEYEGETQVTPSRERVILPTAQKYLSQNITVLPIPDTYPTVQTIGNTMLLSGDLPLGIRKVITGEGTYIETAGDTVTPDKLLEGVTAHGADGNPVTGTIPKMRVQEVITSSAMLPTAGKYLETDIFVDCDTGNAKSGVFTPAENTHVMTLSGVTAYRPTGCVVTATAFGGTGDLFAVFDLQGLGIWFDLQNCSITAQIRYAADGVTVTLPNEVSFKAGTSYRWFLYR